MCRFEFPSSFITRVFLVNGFLLIFSLAAVGQSTTADIRGTVTDASRGVMLGVTVTVTNLDTGAVSTTVSDSTGAYAIRLLPPGRYTVRAEIQGFKAWVVPEVTLAVGDRLRLDPRMEIGQREFSIEVTGTVPAMQTESSNVGSLISLQAVDSLPLVGRNFISLVRLVPGASEGTGRSADPLGNVSDRRPNSYVSVNGLGQNQNNYLLDGIDNNERFNATIVVRTSIDAIQEMRIETNKYSAEFGRTGGGVISIITKSGTNNFHGSLFELLRNEKLDARNFFATTGVTPKPPYKQNQFGGSIGGPIVKNSTFFFLEYEGLRIRQGITSNVSVPTDANRAGLFTQAIYNPLTTRGNPASPGTFIRDPFSSVSGITDISSFINPVAKNVLTLWPAPNGGTAASPTYTQTATRAQRDDNSDARLDHRFGNNDAIFVRFSLEDTTTYIPSQLPVVNGINPGSGAAAGLTDQRGQALGLNFVHTFSPSLVMEVLGGFNRFSFSSVPTNWNVNPSAQLGLQGVNRDLTSSGLAAFTGFTPVALGDAAFLPEFYRETTYQAVGDISYVHSGHNVRIGGEYRTRQVAVYETSNPTPTFSFDATATNNPLTGSGGNPFATFLLGYPTQTQRNMYLVQPMYSVKEIAGFVQDDWHATPWLTLNLGVRWDYYSPATERYNRISNIDLVAGKIVIAGQNGVSRTTNVIKDLNNWQPRLGFAATLAHNTVLRGGFAIAYSPSSWNTPLAFRNAPFVSQISETYSPWQYATSPVPTRSLSTPLPPLNPTSADSALVNGNLAPVDFNLRVPYTQQFNLSLQRQLPGGFVITTAYVGSLVRKMMGSVNVNQLNPGETVRPFASKFPNVGSGSITPFSNRFNSNYHSLQALLERRFRNGLLLQSNYTWSHSIASSAAQARGVLEKDNSGLDCRQRFTLSGNYGFPFFKNTTGLVHAVGAGWQVSGVWTSRSGFWYTVTNLSTRTGFVATSATGGGGGVADRPNVIGEREPGY